MPVLSFHYFIYRERPHLSVSGLSWTVSVFHISFRKNQDNPENYLTVLFLESFFFSNRLFITEVLACIVKAIQELLRQVRSEKLCCILYTYRHMCVCVCVCVYIYIYTYLLDASLLAQTVKNLPPVQETGDQCRSGSRGSTGRKNSPLQYSCLENSMDRGTWWATVHGVTKSQTQLSD